MFEYSSIFLAYTYILNSRLNVLHVPYLRKMPRTDGEKVARGWRKIGARSFTRVFHGTREFREFSRAVVHEVIATAPVAPGIRMHCRLP